MVPCMIFTPAELAEFLREADQEDAQCVGISDDQDIIEGDL